MVIPSRVQATLSANQHSTCAQHHCQGVTRCRLVGRLHASQSSKPLHWLYSHNPFFFFLSMSYKNVNQWGTINQPQLHKHFSRSADLRSTAPNRPSLNKIRCVNMSVQRALLYHNGVQGTLKIWLKKQTANAVVSVVFIYLFYFFKWSNFHKYCNLKGEKSVNSALWAIKNCNPISNSICVNKQIFTAQHWSLSTRGTQNRPFIHSSIPSSIHSSSHKNNRLLLLCLWSLFVGLSPRPSVL